MTKRLFILAISSVVYLVDELRHLLGKAIGRQSNGTCVVLLYHDIPAEMRKNFARQMDALKRVAKPVPADHQAVLDQSRHYVVLTFDDGLISFSEQAQPELEKRGIPAALFVVTGKLGTVPAWTSYQKGGLSKEKMLSAEQLRKIDSKVIIGSHSVTHQALQRLDEAGARYEIEMSRQQLEHVLGRRVTLFSFPHGVVTDALLEYCKDAGYERVFTSLPVLSFAEPAEFMSGRVTVNPTDWYPEFLLKLVGAYRWLPSAFTAKRALFKALRFPSRDTGKMKVALNDKNPV